MRNYSWQAAHIVAGETLDLNNYHRHNDVWIQKDLAQGDIIRCDLPTDFMQTGTPEIKPRNCLLLGIDLNKETSEIDALRVVRFSYFVFDQTEGIELLIERDDPRFQGRISGLTRQAVLRTQRIDIIPATSAYLGFYMDRVGKMDPALFPTVNAHLQEAITRGGGQFRFHDDVSVNDSVLVPSLDPGRFGRNFSFAMPAKAGKSLESLPEEEKESFVRHLQGELLTREMGRALQIRVEKQESQKMSDVEREKQLAIRRVMSAIRGASRNSMRLTASFERVIDVAGAAVAGAQEGDEIGNNGTKLKDIPDYRALLRAHFGLSADDKALARPKIQVNRSVDRDSLHDLQTLGVGGLLREPTINLPEHLWRGRYLMMRIADLRNSENMNNAFRPCAIWKAYAKPDENGDPMLAGFELYPCTRSAAGDFRHKMKVRPLDTTVPVPSFLIAEMIIRAPLNSRYFQPDQREDFYYELLPHQIEHFQIKRDMASQDPRGVSIFGLREVPSEWVELALPEAPNEKLRAKLIDWGKARFPVAGAPDIRPMAGSAMTARRYRPQPR